MKTTRRQFLLGTAAAVAALAAPALGQDSGAMRALLSRLNAEDWDGAAAAAEGDIARDIVIWSRLRAGDGRLGDYEDFLARRADWPGLALVRSRGEEAAARSTDPARVVAYFGGRAPATAKGAIALSSALAALGQGAESEAVAVRAWIDLDFSADAAGEILSLHPQALGRAHTARMDRLLWDGEEAQARRLMPRVPPGWQALAEARLALQAEAPGVDGAVTRVPADLASHPGLAYDRFIWRMNKERYADAASLILDHSTSAEALGRPEAWAKRRANLAREFKREGEPRTAYRIAATHQLQGGGDYADLEFLAGFLALRQLGDAETALAHFRRLRAAVATPISLSRAAYWEGRALEALGRAEDARMAYAYAAEFQTAYYGLLASERAGIALSPRVLGQDRYPDWKSAPFTQSSVYQAAILFLRGGDLTNGKRFLLHLAESLGPQELGQLGDLALDLDEPHLAVAIAKQAAEQGVILPRAYFPVTDLVPDGLAVSRALALSIARRESEFDPVVVSPAGARGLMQVMPGTAKMMAAETGRPYDAGKLTADPAYNAALGSAYLKELVEEFGPSIALIASGYNAGPGRPRRWIEQYGDPRRPDVDVVDWVEMIPFTETRTYVMRVAESVVIYRAKLKGQAGAVDLTGELKG